MSLPERSKRYAAKLLFQFRVIADGIENKRRTCEERIVLIEAASARSALTVAKKKGRAGQHRYVNDSGGVVHIEFVGVLDLLQLGVECEADEVWYEIKDYLVPMERRDQLIPAESELSALKSERRRAPRR